MNMLLLVVAIGLIALQALGIRTMQKDHLFAIAHRAEMALWAMFALFLFSIESAASASIELHDAVQSMQMTPLLKLILLGIMVSRIFSCIAFTLGNPPRVAIVLNEKDDSLVLARTTDSPSVELEKDGRAHVIL